jgi:hypothetical protein
MSATAAVNRGARESAGAATAPLHPICTQPLLRDQNRELAKPVAAEEITGISRIALASAIN